MSLYLTTRLKSKKFTVDQDAGESSDGMVKTETFSGLDFDKQFALKFNDQVKEEIFGKVVVNHKDNTGNHKFIVDFLLQKVRITFTHFLKGNFILNMINLHGVLWLGAGGHGLPFFSKLSDFWKFCNVSSENFWTFAVDIDKCFSFIRKSLSLPPPLL